MSRPRFIVFAYACEPETGSEPGAGWQWAQMLSTFADVWVITRANNREAIATAVGPSSDADRPRFEYVDLPAWSMFWKRGQRGVRLYYLLWQVAALRVARRLHAEIGADVVWHLTLANGWLGSLGPLVGPPFVYGPIGGGIGTAWRQLPGAPRRAVAYEVARASARGLGRYLNPVARLAWARASLILVQNDETRRWLPRRHRDRCVVFPNVVLEPMPAVGLDSLPQEIRTALFAGRLIHWKGAHLAVSAVASVGGWRLLVCGSGRDEGNVRGIVESLKATERVEFLGWRARDEVLELMRSEVDVLLFPSLHDEAGWIVAEALACGLPVICCDRGGPPVIAGAAGIAVPATSPEGTVAHLAHALSVTELPSSETAASRASEFAIGPTTKRLAGLLADAGLVPR